MKISRIRICVSSLLLLSGFSVVASNDGIPRTTGVRRLTKKAKRTKQETTRQRHERVEGMLPGCVPRLGNVPGLNHTVITYYYAIESYEPMDAYTVYNMEMFLFYVLNSAIFWCPSPENDPNTERNNGGNNRKRYLELDNSEIVQAGKRMDKHFE